VEETMKRIFDFIFAIALLVLISPLFLIISIVIKLDSKGPILFKQRRIGKERKEFQIYKFRTMKIDTPNLATDKLTNPDQYITSSGKILRKTSLDEIPQLFNIIKGEMSFVGPRPALYNQYELIDMRDARGINSCIPGITGYAQVNGRDMISDEEKVKLDEYYMQNCSLLLDIKIIFKTFINVVLKKDIKMN
jgi:O-antigen biosynthesis protein WbqP